ncbi:patatin-like phospholipase family protein [Sporomusa acidovorans]|uniref:PNPLA domain-containing protein n=1 Tax=Sporomusa acidovorans (strain ATCC 49682 / DSM 3132 / Mol) TaxID=1123286 RepID=A0ABZ3J2T3_SPOA4|nr:patatin-like phospholipase family protein [Sporomusa acidovorans]OZC20179.1 NTE family protein RssA [Sporomusa acidovorans DSM 3132]SDD42877.1 NTE family protein [Sporomusa acidovorans]
MIVTINNLSRGSRPTIGVALSGGGLKGTSHIGVLKALVDHNIPIDYISGTSAGAIVATMYACGYSPQQMQVIIRDIHISDFIDLKVTTSDLFKHGLKWMLSGRFRFWSVLPTGLLKGDKIEAVLGKFWHERTVRDTKIPLAITAVDLNSADTVFFTSPLPRTRTILNARYYHNALLYEAVRASISIPGVFFPKKYRGMTLVDGAVKNNLPTDILNHMGAEKIIAVDLGYTGQANNEINSVGEILMQCIEIMGREVTLMKSEQYADIIIRPQVSDLDHKDFKQANDFIKRGYHATVEKINEIKMLLL